MAEDHMMAPHAHTEVARAKPDRESLGLLGVVVVVVVVALVLLMLRGCEPAANRNSATGGGKQIVPVEGLVMDTGVVSVWVSEGSDISAILRVAGLEKSKATDMGGGRYVVTVPDGTEDSVVRLLSGINGVHDAGLVYRQSAESSPAEK